MPGTTGHPVAESDAAHVPGNAENQSIVRTNGFYNGFSPAQRNGANAAIRAAIARGEIAVPDTCSVCKRMPDKPLQFHSERYDTLDAYPICRGCHIRLHARFRHPHSWAKFVRGLGEGWFQGLSVDPLSLTRPYDETYPTTL